MNPSHRGRGLGLIGIEERVKELGGTVVISPIGNRGTVVAVRLPLPAPLTEARLARCWLTITAVDDGDSRHSSWPGRAVGTGSD